MRRPWTAALCLLIAPLAEARPYRVSDLLRQESYGQILVDPTGRFAVIERRRRYDSATNYRYDWFVRRLLSRLEVADLSRPGATRPLFAQQEDAGYWTGGFSPSGRFLVVFRLHKERLRAGLFDMRTRMVRWLDFVPDLPIAAPAPVWLNDERLVMVGLPDGQLPELLSAGGQAQDRIMAGWTRSRLGRSSASEKGSGRFADAGLRLRHRTLMVVNASTLSKRVVAEGDIRDLAVSADGRHAAILLRGRASPGPLPREIDPAYEPRLQHLQLIDIARGTTSMPCQACDILPNLLRWSPEGARILFLSRPPGTDWTTGKLQVWDAATGKSSTPLPDNLRPVLEIASGSTRLVRAGWAGDRVIIRAQRGEDPRLDWYALGAGSPHNLTAGLDNPPPRLLAANPKGILFLHESEIWGSSLDGAITGPRVPGHVVSIGLSQFDMNALGARDGTNALPTEATVILRDGAAARLVHLSTHGVDTEVGLAPGDRPVASAARKGLIYRQDPHGVGTLTLVGKRRATLDTINRHLADVDPPRRIAVETAGSDGRRLTHWLFLPPAGPTVPRLVVVPYPGRTFSAGQSPDAGLASPAAMISPMILVGAGYAVLQPSIPLPEEPGDTFSRIAPVVDAAVAAATATGLVSSQPALVIGHSFGGYAAMTLASNSTRVAAVVAVSGLYDLIAGYATPDPRSDWEENGASLTIPVGWFEGGQGRMGAPPWKVLDRYVRNSPFFEVEKVKVPALLLHGDIDYVPVAQAERMFLALLRSGKDARFVRYAGEGHSFASPGNIRDYWRRILDFFAEGSRKSDAQSTPQ